MGLSLEAVRDYCLDLGSLRRPVLPKSDMQGARHQLPLGVAEHANNGHESRRRR
jgi:hypothetical protein